MILVADSGSTKCDWMAIDSDNNRTTTHTMGFNPFFHSADLIEEKLTENDYIQEIKDQVTAVYFYGAGCSSPDRNNIIKEGLDRVFTKSTDTLVDHDLTGAALATSHGDQCIACIIGTGSNSCYFDGTTVHEEVPALGYILGDEASGTYFGKIILTDWLYKRMPEELATEFQSTYKLTKEGIFSGVHYEPNPNVYLASFMRFVSDHKEHPYFKEMIYEGMAKFISTHVWCYDNFREVPVNFVGSVAYYFRDALEEVAKNHKFTIGKIDRRPIDSLADYHMNNKLQNK